MTTETMNVHKALCELKILNTRIDSEWADRKFVFSNKHSNTKVRGVPIEDYCGEIRSDYQRIKDLITRRDAIKRAVVLSNSITKVIVGGKEYTVAEAIEMKNNGIPIRKRLLAKLVSDYRLARQEADRDNGEQLESRADDYIGSIFGTNTNFKDTSNEIKRARADFIAAQTREVVDPIKINDEIKALDAEITTFEVEIDSALSVSNALTEITFEY